MAGRYPTSRRSAMAGHRPHALPAALLLAACCLLLAPATASGRADAPQPAPAPPAPVAAAPAAARAKPDGYTQPLAKNAKYYYYQFDALHRIDINSVITPSGASDDTAPGTVAAGTGELFNTANQTIGINQWTRTVVGDDFKVPDVVGQRVVRSLLTIHYEFGTAADDYFDDTLVTVVSTKRLASGASLPFADYDSVVTGGTGKFLGASGYVTLKDAVFQGGTIIVKQGLLTFHVWVPRDLPMPKNR